MNTYRASGPFLPFPPPTTPGGMPFTPGFPAAPGGGPFTPGFPSAPGGGPFTPGFPSAPGGGPFTPGFPSGPGGGPFTPGFPSGPGGGPGVGLPQGITPPPPQLLSSFQQLSQFPSQVQSFVFQQPPQGITTFAAGCQNRWTLIVTRNFNVFLMFVTSTSPFGFTEGFLFPTFAFGRFPSSIILWYSCF